MQVLIVDDDIATVDVIEHSVNWKKLGVDKTFSAYNVSSAKEILKNEKIDIVVSDIEMPQGSGIDLLEWFREQKLSGEFLLLTCHESFDYATNAIKYQASEYLLKPFDVNIMEAALQKMIQKIYDRERLKEESEFGKWAKKNQRQMQLTFWNEILTGHMAENRDVIATELEKRKLAVNTETSYNLIVSKITEIQGDREKMSPDLMQFVAENIHAEILCGNPINDSVVSMNYDTYYVLAAVCENADNKTLMERCERLRKEFRRFFASEITICICKPCHLEELYRSFHRALALLESNVAFYGACFLEEESTEVERSANNVFELSDLENFFTEKKKMEFLSYLKSTLNGKQRDKTLTDQVLRRGKEEILQAGYMYLGKKGIQASGIFANENLVQLGDRAAQSIIDMIRWANYLIDCIYEYEENIQKSYTLSDKINQYIREHYTEDIGRTEIAEQFFLAPEYLSKTYKKQTGKSIKDMIAECRIEEAKGRLERGERVSDVAEAVGFDNFTYFSTTFKKYTGVTPNQYRKK